MHGWRMQSLAADSNWNTHSLSNTFLHSLSDQIIEQLPPLYLPTNFDSFVALAIKIEDWQLSVWEEKGKEPTWEETPMDLKEVFNNARAMSLPPHRPYYCAIGILPGASIYSLSAPKIEAMNQSTLLKSAFFSHEVVPSRETLWCGQPGAVGQ